MATITLIFQAGFNDDDIIVTLNQQRQHLQGLTTDYSIGYADKLELEAQPGKNRLHLDYPKSDQQRDLHIDSEENPFVLVDLSPEKVLEIKAAPEETPRY